MQKRIVVVGSGFAGMWAALAAARLVEQKGGDNKPVEVIVVSPQPVLPMRPRFYEQGVSEMAAPLLQLFIVAGIRYVQGTVEQIDPTLNIINVTHADDTRSQMSFDALVLATGSRLYRPAIPGVVEHTFSIDQIDDAAEFETHIRTLSTQQPSEGRNTAVVCGGGFTGIELAAELPARLRASLGANASVRVIIVERENEIGPDLGPGPRPVIQKALAQLGVEYRLGVAISKVDTSGVTLSNGDHVASHTVVWTAGLRASSLTAQIPGNRDGLGRLLVDANLRVPGTTNIFAAGDTARAFTDEDGHTTLMSCQHALELGRFAGNNAAALLLGLTPIPYRQPNYVTGLDLGPWGAVHTSGWERTVVLQGAESKKRKQWVNSVYIYPPQADRAVAFAAANPVRAER